MNYANLSRDMTSSKNKSETHSVRSINKSQNQSVQSQSYLCKFTLQVSTNTSIIKHLNLENYKTTKCPEDCDNIKTCPFYHTLADRRRNPTQSDYNPQICHFGIHCLKKHKCVFSHNKFELKYHPLKYKKKYCKNLFDVSKCKFGKFCADAHFDEELSCDLLHYMDFDDDFMIFKYKTEFCPFNLEHNLDKCVYAHSWEDYRRNIILFPYSNIACPNVEGHDESFEVRCENENECQYAHGGYEIEFHPLNYKRTKCNKGECDGLFCSLAHGNEKSKFDKIANLDNFYIYPYNRILPGKLVQATSFFKEESHNIMY